MPLRERNNFYKLYIYFNELGEHFHDNIKEKRTGLSKEVKKTIEEAKSYGQQKAGKIIQKIRSLNKEAQQSGQSSSVIPVPKVIRSYFIYFVSSLKRIPKILFTLFFFPLKISQIYNYVKTERKKDGPSIGHATTRDLQQWHETHSKEVLEKEGFCIFLLLSSKLDSMTI